MHLVSDTLFVGTGEMATLMREHDWAQTPLGPVDTWSPSLRTALSICLNSRFPMVIWWGKQLVLLYNDAWRPILGTKHPQSLGQPGQVVWGEIWEIIGAQLTSVLETGQATWSDDMLLLVDRFGYVEEAYFTYSYSPIFLETGEVGGAFTAVTETTRRVIGERRLSTLRELASSTINAKSVEAACQIATTTLAHNPFDVPFALLYLVEQEGQLARLVGQTGLAVGTPASPEQVDLTPAQEQAQDCWHLAQARRTGEVKRLDVTTGFAPLPGGAWEEPARSAVVLPIAQSGQQHQLAGFLVLGVSPRQEFDDEYKGFFDLVVNNVATAIANATAYEAERQRAESLAELDRAKTVFFSNVSHEFRTPLTLMLGPTEDALSDTTAPLPPQQQERIETVQRNGLRLLKLVNTLLDFSRIESGRVQATYEPTDLATFTAELASVFRSAIERAQLRLRVECPPLPAPVYVDREMWEKIVFNLLSNAFKFTFTGEIVVSLRWVAEHVELAVQDTGIGIPAAELPHLFERFHRVKGAQGRTIEGSGIGLSLVQELVQLHEGTIRVESVEGKGTCFTVVIPSGTAHLPSERIRTPRSLVSTAITAASFVEEALRWLPDSESALPSILTPASLVAELGEPSLILGSTEAAARILLVDDNADMRDYVRRLLSQCYTVEVATDGLTALQRIRQQPPDLVLTDVMMPGLDGFELLRELRADPETQQIPIILLSARAGAESRLEGLAAGADDYLIKPFSARELLARVESSLKLAQVRQTASHQEQRLRVEAQTAREDLDRVVASINDQFFTLDHEWHYSYVNDRVAQTIGLEREALLGQNIWELFPKLVGTQFELELRRAVTEQTAVHFEYCYEDWNRWFENYVYPSPEGLVLFVTDVTERKQTQQALQAAHHELAQRTEALEQANESLQLTLEELQVAEEELRGHNEELAIAHELAEIERRRYQDLFNFAPDGYVVTDTRGVIQEANQTIALLVNVEPGFLIGQPLSVYVAESGRPGFRNLLYELTQQSAWQKVQSDEYRLKPINRPAIPVAITVTPIQDSQARLIGARWLIQDITARLEIEQERDRLLAQEQAARTEAEQANRVKDEFLAVLSHELRSPLNPILGWTKLLLTRKFDPQATRQALETIERNAKVQTQLIEDLLDVSRILRGKMVLHNAPVNLRTTIEAALETVRLAAEAKGISIQKHLDSQVGPVSGDSARLQQVMWNLLSNAVKFTPPGGQVEIWLEAVENSAQIRVKDTGKGIHPDFLAHVFDYFRQEDGKTTRQFGGLGLGLAIVRHLLELHGGTIQADSLGEGLGATFTVRLPLLTQPGALGTSLDFAPEVSDLEMSAPLQGLQILVVDDEADVRDLMLILLEQYGAKVQVATCARAALALLEQDRPDVLISDIGMPEMDGYMLMTQVKKQLLLAKAKIPAIALTAYASELDRNKAIAAGFQTHIAKPVAPEELVKAILSLVRV